MTESSKNTTKDIPKDTTKDIPKDSAVKMNQLPASCNGVNSMELDLYPTGKQCFTELTNRVQEWCLSENDEHIDLADDCRKQFYLELLQQCEDPVISSVDVCLMDNFKNLYPKLIP